MLQCSLYDNLLIYIHVPTCIEHTGVQNMLEKISTAVSQLKNKPATAVVCNLNILCMVYVCIHVCYPNQSILGVKKSHHASTKMALSKKM